MPNHYYIGIANSFHDPAIAIVSGDGEVLFAEAAERRYQVKRAMGCPPDNYLWIEDTIRQYCKPGAGFTIITTRNDRYFHRLKLRTVVRLSGSKLLSGIVDKALSRAGVPKSSYHNALWVWKSNLAMRRIAGGCAERTIKNIMAPSGVSVRGCDHHESHSGLACYGSPFNDAICLVADGGGGEDNNFSVYRYSKGKVSLLERHRQNANLGYFYSKITTLCGFDPTKGEEWKTMGLAAHGRMDEVIYNSFRKLYTVKDCEVIPQKGQSLFRVLADVGAMANRENNSLHIRANIAHAGQAAYASWMNELISNIHRKYPSDNLILTGGCALNSSHNGQIIESTPFKSLYVPSAPADDGNALGAALLAYYSDYPNAEPKHKNISPYLGSDISSHQLQQLTSFGGLPKARKLGPEKYDVVAQLIAGGKIVGWMQGRAEFGPRALGNRSILADPRNKNIKDIINERVKFREEFRPFAPSILHEYGDEYFEHYQESHYMERTLTFKKDMLDKVPGVVHIDNTGRLQTVKEEWNKELHHLLHAFHSITDVPVLLNTSFNVMGKPIIHSIADALGTFFTSGIDVLVINDYLIEK